MERTEERLFRFRIELEDAAIGDDRGRTASRKTRALPPVAPVAVSGGRDVEDLFHEPMLRVIQQDDEPAKRRTRYPKPRRFPEAGRRRLAWCSGSRSDPLPPRRRIRRPRDPTAGTPSRPGAPSPTWLPGCWEDRSSCRASRRPLRRAPGRSRRARRRFSRASPGRAGKRSGEGACPRTPAPSPGSRATPRRPSSRQESEGLSLALP